jgi:hypothetical protein
MELRYVSDSSIVAVLAEDEALYTTAGPCEVSFAAAEGQPYFEAALATGLPIAPYEPPVPTIPAEIQRHQGLIALLLGPGITEQMIRDAIADVADPTARELTRIRLEQPVWRRDSEFIAWGASVFGLTPEQVDQLFIAGAGA